ncbi:hypothetical protein IKQ26_09710 [bacterium]|nr:hypothetical protein [bacterium]
MNIFKGLKVVIIINKVKKYFDNSRIDEEMKEIIGAIRDDFERLIKKAPELKDTYINLKNLIIEVFRG